MPPRNHWIQIALWIAALPATFPLVAAPGDAGRDPRAATTASAKRELALDEHPNAPTSKLYGNPQRVTLLGYDDDAMEPFLTRDGHYLISFAAGGGGNIGCPVLPWIPRNTPTTSNTNSLAIAVQFCSRRW